MKLNITVTAAVLFIASFSYAAQHDQQSKQSISSSAKANSKAQSSKDQSEKRITLDADSQIQAEMSSTLDLKKARPGDQFKMKTARPVKRDGKEIISRGSTITGHVEQVTRADDSTKATLVFDRLEDKKTGATASLEAVITAVTKIERNAPAMMDDAAATRPPVNRGEQQSGGLLGGAVSAVGGITGQVTSTVDGAVGIDSTAGGAVTGLTRNTIQIVTDTTAEVASATTLTAADRNAKLESGTRLVLKTTSQLIFENRSKEKSADKNQ